MNLIYMWNTEKIICSAVLLPAQHCLPPSPCLPPPSAAQSCGKQLPSCHSDCRLRQEETGLNRCEQLPRAGLPSLRIHCAACSLRARLTASKRPPAGPTRSLQGIIQAQSINPWTIFTWSIMCKNCKKTAMQLIAQCIFIYIYICDTK